MNHLGRELPEEPPPADIDFLDGRRGWRCWRHGIGRGGTGREGVPAVGLVVGRVAHRGLAQ